MYRGALHRNWTHSCQMFVWCCLWYFYQSDHRTWNCKMRRGEKKGNNQTQHQATQGNINCSFTLRSLEDKERLTCTCCSCAWPLLCGIWTVCRIHRCCTRPATPRSVHFPTGSLSLRQSARNTTDRTIKRTNSYTTMNLFYNPIKFL